LLGIGRALRDRGHQVSFVTGKPFQQMIARAGFERIPFGDQDSDSFSRPFWMRDFEIMRQSLHIAHAIQQEEPAAIVTAPLTVGPLVVRRAFHIPVAVLGLAAYMWPKHPTLPDLPEHPALQKELVSFHNHLCTLVKEGCRRLDIPVSATFGTNPVTSPLMGDRFLFRSVPELENVGHPPPAGICYVGALSHQEPDPLPPDLTDWLETRNDRPTILVDHALGKDIPDFWDNLVKAMEGLHLKAIAIFDTPGDRFLPNHVFGAAKLPRESLLPHISAVVTIGRSSTVLGALNHGLPMLMFPLGGEQKHLTLRCVRAGVGIDCSTYDWETGEPRPERYAPNTLREYLQAMLDEESAIRTNARRLKHAFRAINSFDVAADTLEQLPKDPFVLDPGEESG
jgi:UDP:flavonoid glycosyltransferase YjiC (YdhE family)